MIVPSGRSQIKDPFGLVGCGVINSRTAPGAGRWFFKAGAVGGKTRFGEAKKDKAKDRSGIFLGFEPGIGAELVGCGPKPFFAKFSVCLMANQRGGE